MNKKGRLFVVSAPSGAGKTTLCEEIIKRLPGVVRSVSMTTREKRPGEKNGKDYSFISVEEFKKRLKTKEFIEYAKVFGNYYGTPKKFVESNLNKNRDVVLTIDVQGAMQIRKNFKKGCIFIFILPPSIKHLRKRLEKRKTDSTKVINSRLKIAKKELTFLKYYDYEVINDDLKTAFEELKSIFIASRCQRDKN
ncbi:MAG: guanylate kinase [Candidatus Omnitrophica bacterium]|nr:guanylate kinase [Candidatus Omnitrophota bacterium]